MLTLDQQAQERALLAAIRAEPGEDAHRLIYADWLEETGDDERAEFIRVQVAGRTPRRIGGPTILGHACLAMLGGRTYAVSSEPGKVVVCGSSDQDDQEDTYLTCRRGFVTEVKCPLAAWEKHGPALVARHPVGRVELTDVQLEFLPGWGVRWSDVRRIFPEGTFEDYRFRLAHLHDTKEEAAAVFSSVLLDWANSLAFDPVEPPIVTVED